mgnify:CR=1 FL=1
MKRLLVTVSVLVAIALFFYLVIWIGWFNGYSDGERTGDVFKFSKKGLIFKSWEGELYLGGLVRSGESGLEIEKFYFSIPEEQEVGKLSIIETLQKCARERLNCTIAYKQWFKEPIYQDSNYTVEKVEVSLNQK